MIETALFQILSTDSAITALVPASRIHPVVLQQDTAYPAITYRRLSSKVNQTMTGFSVEPKFQIRAYSKTYLQAKDLAEKIVTAMTKTSGVIAGTSIQIKNIAFENDADKYSDELKVYFVASDFSVSFCEL